MFACRKNVCTIVGKEKSRQTLRGNKDFHYFMSSWLIMHIFPFSCVFKLKLQKGKHNIAGKTLINIFLFAFAASHFIMGFQLEGETVQSFHPIKHTSRNQKIQKCLLYVCVCECFFLQNEIHFTQYMCMYIYKFLIYI